LVLEASVVRTVVGGRGRVLLERNYFLRCKRFDSSLPFAQENDCMVGHLAVTREHELLEGLSLDILVTMLSTQNDDSWVRTNLKLLVIDACLCCYNDPVFLFGIFHNADVFGTHHNVPDKLDIQRSRGTPKLRGQRASDALVEEEPKIRSQLRAPALGLRNRQPP